MTTYHLYANRHNIGDFLSALSIKRYLKRDMMDLFADTGYFENTKKAILGLRKEDTLIIGGGGLFMNYFLPVWDTIIDNYHGCKVIIWGAGECIYKQNIYTGLSDKTFKSISDVATLISVRDYTTQERFSKFSFPCEMVGCPSTALVASWPKIGKKYLLHIVHSDHLKTLLPYWKESCIRLATKTGLQYAEINHILPRKRIDRYLYWLRLIYLYGTAGVIVSSRLHGIILGSTRHIPIIPISNDYKIESYWKGSLGGQNILSLNQFDDLEDFYFSEHYDNPDTIYEKAKGIVKINNKFSKKVMNIFNSSSQEPEI